MATSSPDREAILKAIAEWPVEDQVIFAREVLQQAADRSATQEDTSPGAPSERSTWDALYGVASNGQEPPTDK